MKSRLLRAYLAFMIGFVVWTGLFHLYPKALSLAADHGWVQVVCTNGQLDRIETIVREGIRQKVPVETIGEQIDRKMGHKFYSQLVISADHEGYSDRSILTFHGMVPNEAVNKYSTLIQDPEFLVEMFPVLQSFFIQYESLILCAAIAAAILFFVLAKHIPVLKLRPVLSLSFVKTMTGQLFGIFGAAIISFCVLFGLMYMERYTLIDGIQNLVDWRQKMDERLQKIEKELSGLSEDKEMHKVIRKYLPKSAQAFLYGSDGNFMDAVNSSDPDMLDYTSHLEPVYYSKYIPIDSGKDEVLLTITDYPFLKEIRIYVAGAFLYSSFIVLFWLHFYMSGLITRIRILEKHVEAFSLGDWEYPIAAGNKDELDHLGMELEQMRVSYMEKTEQERKAQRANQALITDLSHDLRTPLTVLKGYLEIISRQDPIGDEKAKRYIVLANEKADQIKELSDRLFEVALVGRKRVTLHKEAVKSWHMEKMVEERCRSLEQRGFTVYRTTEVKYEEYEIDRIAFVRILDNVFSNLEKYADPACGIEVRFTADDNMKLHVVNAKRMKKDQESARVGLQSVRKLLKAQQGSLQIRETETMFEQTIRIPRSGKE